MDNETTLSWGDLAELGFCDYCGGTFVLGSDTDHNPETGNHYECERGEA